MFRFLHIHYIFLKNVKVCGNFFCFVLVLSRFFNDSRRECFQIYMSDLGIMGGHFCKFSQSLHGYHSTCMHKYFMKSLSFIGKTCILVYTECPNSNFWYRNCSIDRWSKLKKFYLLMKSILREEVLMGVEIWLFCVTPEFFLSFLVYQ